MKEFCQLNFLRDKSWRLAKKLICKALRILRREAVRSARRLDEEVAQRSR